MQRLDAAAADKDVLAVWLKIEDLAVGRGKIHELRGADRPAAEGQQAGLRRTDHRRQRRNICWPRPATRSSCRRPAC